MKLGPRRNYHKGRAASRAFSVISNLRMDPFQALEGGRVRAAADGQRGPGGGGGAGPPPGAQEAEDDLSQEDQCARRQGRH